MCELCTHSDEKNVLIELHNIHLKTGAKFEAGIEAITKALGYDSERQQKEISPFKAVRELEEISKDRVEEGLLKLYDAIRTTWITTEKAKKDNPFVLNGRIFINPKNGKPLTNGQWKTIKQDVLRAFDYLYAYEEERIALHALSLGKVIKGLPLDKKLTSSYKSLKPAIDDAMKKLTGPEWQDTVAFAKQEAAAKIVELKQKQYLAIHNTVQNAIKNRATVGKLTEDLYDTFGGMNRDWRRIAETEIGDAQNNGQLVTELNRRKPGEKYVFMKGISSGEACPWCRNEVDGKIVVLLEAPPNTGGDKVTVDGEDYTAIWPGKSNYGRKRSNWRVAAGTQHPHAILPGQEISSALPSTVMKGFYEGPVVKITTEGGSVLSVTENHPILTPFGFVKAKFLCKGMDILKSTNTEGMMKGINPNNYQRNILIEDFFTAAKHSSAVPSIVMPSSSEYFHGDGRFMNKTIDIVNTYGLLGSDLEATLLKLNYQRLLDSIRLRFGLSTDSDFLKGVSGSWFSSLGDVSLPGKALPLLRGAFGHSNSVALRDVSEDDAVLFDKSLSEGGATHSALSREFIYRFSSDVSFDESLREFGGITWGSPAFLVSDKIRHIETSLYSGSVYDVTDDIYGLYTCNGVVVKNCRCTWVKHIPGYEKWDDKFRQAMNQARKKGEHMKKPPNDFGEELKPNPF